MLIMNYNNASIYYTYGVIGICDLQNVCRFEKWGHLVVKIDFWYSLCTLCCISVAVLMSLLLSFSRTLQQSLKTL